MSVVLPKLPIFATNENGITKTNSYQIRCTLTPTSIVKATASTPDVKVEVSPIVDAKASVRCTYQGQEKIYFIN